MQEISNSIKILRKLGVTGTNTIGVIYTALGANIFVYSSFQTFGIESIFTMFVSLLFFIPGILWFQMSETINKVGREYLIDRIIEGTIHKINGKLDENEKPIDDEEIYMEKNLTVKVKKRFKAKILSLFLPLISLLIYFIFVNNTSSFNNQPSYISDNAIHNYENEWYKIYDVYATKEGKYKSQYNLISNTIELDRKENDLNILDAACGTGDVLALFLTDSMQMVNIFGTDGSYDMLDYAKNKHTFSDSLLSYSLWQDLDSTFFSKKQIYFDLIFILGNSMAQLVDSTLIKRSFLNIQKWLKPNGKFIVDYDQSLLNIKQKSPIFVNTIEYNNNVCSLFQTIKRKGDILICDEELFHHGKKVKRRPIKYLSYALQKDYLNRWLLEAGYSVNHFSDSKYEYNYFICNKN